MISLIKHGLTYTLTRAFPMNQCCRAFSSQINASRIHDNTEKLQTIREIFKKRDRELGIPNNGITLAERAEYYIAAVKEGRISNFSMPIVKPEATLEEAAICCSGEWRLRKNYALLRKAADEGRIFLPQNMPFLDKV
jgi:hypothetical protein